MDYLPHYHKSATDIRSQSPLSETRNKKCRCSTNSELGGGATSLETRGCTDPVGSANVNWRNRGPQSRTEFRQKLRPLARTRDLRIQSAGAYCGLVLPTF